MLLEFVRREIMLFKHEYCFFGINDSLKLMFMLLKNRFITNNFLEEY